MKKVNGYYFPDYDNKCNSAVFKELWKLSVIINKCKSHDTVIQAGGNVGLFAVELSKYFDEVVTFEPDSENYYCLVQNIIDRGISNINYLKAGIGDSPSWGTIYQPEDEDNCGSLAMKESTDVDAIPILTIDDISYNKNVDLIYLDIEGFEYKALLGAEETINRCKPILAIENKGLIPEFGPVGFKPEGSEEFRDWVEETFNYILDTRLMRDDIFIPKI